MPEIIRTRVDVFKDMYKLFMRQAPAWSAREEFQRLARELDEVWNREIAEYTQPPTETTNVEREQMP